MDTARRQAINGCGNCGQPEDAHQHAAGTGEDDLALFAALGGPCTRFAASDAAVIYQKHLAIAGNRTPKRQPDGRLGKRNPLCPRCRNRHPGECPL